VLYLSASFSHARQPYLHEDLRVITIRGNLSSGNLHKTSVRLFKRVAMIVDFEDQKTAIDAGPPDLPGNKRRETLAFVPMGG
jgi:hypothetical protein